ncbi:type II secretion system protein [bacterium]|nr:type II secretion system protein [bacterium]
MKKAFTTAELLIAMTIIGVVAALVMPGFMQDYSRKIYVTHIKKVYGLILSGVEQACADGGVSNFKMTKYSKSGNEEEFLTKYLKIKDTSNIFADSYKSISGESLELSLTGTSVKLAGSESVNMSCDVNSICKFTVDVNGTEKPNIGGRDLYTFTVNPTENIIEDADDADNCATNANGSGCLQKLIDKDWTMDY